MSLHIGCLTVVDLDVEQKTDDKLIGGDGDAPPSVARLFLVRAGVGVIATKNLAVEKIIVELFLISLICLPERFIVGEQALKPRGGGVLIPRQSVCLGSSLDHSTLPSGRDSILRPRHTPTRSGSARYCPLFHSH